MTSALILIFFLSLVQLLSINCLANADEKQNIIASLLSTCGSTSSERIAGGKNAAIGQFPWMALIANAHPPSKRNFYCGGSIISNRYILTAAHCIKSGNSIAKSVRLGELNIDNKTDCENHFNNIVICADPPVNIAVEATIIHENYNDTTLRNDIAIIRLASDITYSNYITSICLPFSLNLTDKSYKSKRFTLAGWGRTKARMTIPYPHLQFTNLMHVDTDTCNNAVAPEKRPITNKQLCVNGTSGEDACKGDSGGPLMHYGAGPDDEVRAYQIGIVSSGVGLACGGSYQPSIHIKVQCYLDWIVDKIIQSTPK